MNEVRVRFAPSPTGYLHIGGARTALFNWLFAKKNKGSFVLRVEDTDRERLKEDSVSQILASLRWLGLDWDEGPEKGGDFGPYYQSQRGDLYLAAAASLRQSGQAYYCFCSAAELADEREKQAKKGLPLRYSGKCRHLSAEEVQERLARGLQPVLRLKVPITGQIVVQDLIRGAVTFQYEELDDFIILKSNGLPTYNFACVVDDRAMRISHVIRAEEHLSNTPRQQFLYQALGYPVPQFAHLSMILAPDRSKLSKRHGATAVNEFQELGCLPEAMVNYLTLLGWSPPEEIGEFFAPAEIIDLFSLAKVSKTAAIYDLPKLMWLNGQYLQKYDLVKLGEQVSPFLAQAGIVTKGEELPEERAYLLSVLDLVRSRVKSLPELADAVTYFFKEIETYEARGLQKYFTGEKVAVLLSHCRERLAGLVDFTAESIEKEYRDLSAELQIKTAQLIHPSRLALTGRTATPGLFAVMALLGRKKCLQRLARAIAFIKGGSGDEQINSRSEKAVELFKNGYNCTQAVVGAFCDEMGLDFKTAMRLSSSFGGGMGRLREVCGAVSGMFMVAGLMAGYSDPGDRQAREEHYRLIQELAAQFEKENGSIVCKELLGLSPPRTQVVSEQQKSIGVKKHSCLEIVGYAAQLLDVTWGRGGY